jgi:hypothetical protein
MHFSDDELREALRRKDPGEAFTQKVMARVSQQVKGASGPSAGNRFQEFWGRLGLRPVLAWALLAVLAVGVAIGLGWRRQVLEARAGEAAKKQALLALRITNAKLNHVLERAKNTQAP